MKILNTIANFSASAQTILAEVAEVTYEVPEQNELGKVLADYDVALVGIGLRFDQAVLESATKLKVIATATTGLDYIDVTYAKKRGVEVLSLRGEEEFLNTITSTAELAFFLALNLMGGVMPAAEAVKNYQWDRERFRGHSMSGNTLGVVGVGRLGRMMVRYGQAFEMRVLGSDPNVDVAALGAEAVDLDQLVGQSDLISIHVHLTPETENLFKQSVFSKMKPTAYLINTSRGKIVNEADLLQALEEKKLAGYAADVLAGQLEFNQGFSNYPLVEYAKHHDNCLIVPHLGGVTFESREATDLFMARKLIDYCRSNIV